MKVEKSLELAQDTIKAKNQIINKVKEHTGKINELTAEMEDMILSDEKVAGKMNKISDKLKRIHALEFKKNSLGAEKRLLQEKIEDIILCQGAYAEDGQMTIDDVE
jgi:hypothetical protein